MGDRTKLEQKHIDEASEFLEALASETGVSREFLAEARPAIDIVFTEIPEARRDSLLVTVKEIALNQATTEQSIRRAQLGATMLHETQARLTARLRALADQTRQLATSFAGLQLSLYQSSRDQLPN
jgi:hypothetical protein